MTLIRPAKEITNGCFLHLELFVLNWLLDKSKLRNFKSALEELFGVQGFVPLQVNAGPSTWADPVSLSLGASRAFGSPYYDNVRPLSYPDSDAVLICFDISRPETLDSVLKKWKGEIQEFCPNTKMLLVGCKSDLRTDVSTLVELSNHRQTPVSYDQGANMAKQIGAATYIECSALQSENSVRDIFHVATLACVNKTNKNVKRNKSQRATKRISHMPGRPELSTVATDLRKDKAKSCTVM
ncbi:PREDICTED: rho-related GTP-binding protein RhoE [Corvus brachyrhynchos]|uniref:rho-related GTP-binding protein RhoE n=1 Tax=Corvus brachyrhynchos TaxID=85066 RepID=UPI0008167E7E|nr:PREDICTED: rho-related GTP-binding protein RhoE [Corvus brachyrhynchos]